MTNKIGKLAGGLVLGLTPGTASGLVAVAALVAGMAVQASPQTPGASQSSTGSQNSASQTSTTGTSTGAAQMQPQNGSTNPYAGSVVEGKATAEVLQLSLDDAIYRGLRNNLGWILENQTAASARGQKLQSLQALLPTINGTYKAAVAQTDLQAQGLRIPGFPVVIGPYSYQDVRGSVSQALLNVPALENYLAAKHNFEAAKLTADDARDMVVLTVGNAYLTVISDVARVEAAQAQVNSTKVSLDQAVANHEAGTSPLLDELRARVDYQTQQQTLINAQNVYEKDKIALARVIGLPLDQKFSLTDQAPYAQLDLMTPEQATDIAFKTRKDLRAAQEQVEAAHRTVTAARAERLPSADFQGDYGDIGVTLNHSHGSGQATGEASVPIFEEARLRGDAKVADAQKKQREAQASNASGQVEADVRDSILDIQSAQKQVEVARSNVQLAQEALSEAQQRFQAGVSDNLAVVQAQASLSQANDQYISSLYQHNVAKLSLARAMGVARQDYSHYLGGK